MLKIRRSWVLGLYIGLVLVYLVVFFFFSFA